MCIRRAAALLCLAALGAAAAACGRPPLHGAVSRGDVAEVERLLAAGTDPNPAETYTQRGHSGASFRLTPLAIAAQRGDVAMIERLVGAGADPHWSDGSFTAFEWAIRFGHPGAARRLWELSDGATYAGRAAVHLPLTLRVGDDATLAFVLERVGAQSCEAAAALPPLARSGVDELRHVRTLVERGVRPTPEAVQAAAQRGNVALVGLLIDTAERDGWLGGCFGALPARHDPLAGALRASLLGLQIEVVRHLLERGADPNVRDGSGTTPAMLLARHVYLKEVYARPPYADPPYASPSPYHERWFAPLLALLLEHGADLSLRDDAGRSAADFVPDDDHDRAYKRALLRADARAGPQPGSGARGGPEPGPAARAAND